MVDFIASAHPATNGPAASPPGTLLIFLLPLCLAKRALYVIENVSEEPEQERDDGQWIRLRHGRLNEFATVAARGSALAGFNDVAVTHTAFAAGFAASILSYRRSSSRRGHFEHHNSENAMKALMRSAIVAALFTSVMAVAAPPADAPAGTMGKCKDGSYSSSAQKKGACKGHKGVEDWYETDTATAPAGKAAPAGAAATATGTTEVTPATRSVAATSPKTGAPTAAQAPGGGAGQVWVNSKSKVYHCSGDKWYGKTKSGEYMTEAAAKAAGDRAEHGKACS